MNAYQQAVLAGPITRTERRVFSQRDDSRGQRGIDEVCSRDREWRKDGGAAKFVIDGNPLTGMSAAIALANRNRPSLCWINHCRTRQLSWNLFSRVLRGECWSISHFGFHRDQESERD